MSDIEAPITKPDPHMKGSTVTTHPAFAEISVNHYSGSTHLYGSDFSHMHFIALRIARSELHRNLSDDRPMAASSPLIEVMMSEAQWAHLISSVGGQGNPCTLRSFNGERVPQIPAPKTRVEQFADESNARIAQALQNLETVISTIQGNKKLSQAEKRALIQQVQHACWLRLMSRAGLV